MVRSWKDQFQNREIRTVQYSTVQSKQSWLGLGKIENIKGAY